MSTTGWIILAIVVVAIVVAAMAWMRYAERRRSAGLQDRFGPEYDRTVGQARSRRAAERDLVTREDQFGDFEAKPLTEASRARFTQDWDHAERLFVDDPEGAAREADRLVRQVLDERGYPDDDLDTRAAAVSVGHPEVVQRYRHGHEMVQGNGASGQDRTENLRKAMVDFRAVFSEMIEPEREPAAH
jgi:hypothetical protein